ncbi:hypothetical protein L3Y34_005662 [Caenorhabditis briggsae]|uniref:Uncharacterized protein n=2 Tax=Caenorhabditis briggsae TaxID=6238 RepID=A0AAE9D7L2_CAEBR|nr:hypothetical protein L3Y34_005662 [Caenorhabditis briggsae]
MLHPEIIVEEMEDEESEEEEKDDVATPLRPTDAFPLKRRNSPYLQKLSDDHLKHLRELSAPSPTPTQCSTVSKHEFQNWRINEDVMKDMMHIANNHRNQYKTSRDMRLGR